MTQEQPTLKENAEVFLCSSCGTAMGWEPTTQKFRCPSCLNEEDLSDTANINELPFTPDYIEKAKADWGLGRITVSCNSCGAEISVDENVTSVKCSYCNSPHVLTKRQEAGLPPEGVIPFGIDQKAANEIFSKWVKKRFFAPNKLKKLYHQMQIDPVFLPYWTFDANTFTTWSAQGGKVYYVTVGHAENRRQERKVRWTSLHGKLDKFFNDVLVNASGLQKNFISKIENYNTVVTKPYKPEYLAGIGTQHYSILPEEGFNVAQKKIELSLRNEITRNIKKSYDEVSFLNLNTNYSNVTFKHLLVPVYRTGFMYKDKLYSCIINGQTSKIAGEYPKSIIKILLTIFIPILIFAAVYFITMYFTS